MLQTQLCISVQTAAMFLPCPMELPYLQSRVHSPVVRQQHAVPSPSAQACTHSQAHGPRRQNTTVLQEVHPTPDATLHSHTSTVQALTSPPMLRFATPPHRPYPKHRHITRQQPAECKDTSRRSCASRISDRVIPGYLEHVRTLYIPRKELVHTTIHDFDNHWATHGRTSPKATPLLDRSNPH